VAVGKASAEEEWDDTPAVAAAVASLKIEIGTTEEEFVVYFR
jgi:hypothetical protein